MKKICEKVYETNSLDHDELLYILDNCDDYYLRFLCSLADSTRQRIYQKSTYLRGLIEFSNYCKNTCLYCGLQRSNRKVERYRMDKEEIIFCCMAAYDLGYRTFVLQSGEDGYYSDELLGQIIQEIKESCPNAAITLSIGEKEVHSYQRYFDAGADRYLLRHETISRRLYEELHPEMDFDRRISCLWNLKMIGYQVGAGFIVGLPGQTNKDITNDILFLKQLGAHMVGIGPLIPHPDTPLALCQSGSVNKTILCLALTRLMLPEVLLPSTTALNVLEEGAMQKALQAGANVLMPNISPLLAKKRYELYKGREERWEEGLDAITENFTKKIQEAGYETAMERGDHIAWRR